MNFKTARILFICSIIIIGLLSYFAKLSLWWLLLPILIFKAKIIYSSATISSDFYLKSLNHGDRSLKQIAITFDDGPNAEYTNKIMDVLAEFNAKATFFVIGKNILGNESIVSELDKKGHTIGNHSYSHSFFIDFKSKNGFIEEINHTNSIVEKIIGKKIKLFRPPYGVTTPAIASAVKKLNVNVIGWDVRSMDTTKDNETVVFRRVSEQIKPGSILLFHDTSDKTVSVLKQTLNFANHNGFKIVSIEELLKIKIYE